VCCLQVITGVAQDRRLGVDAVRAAMNEAPMTAEAAAAAQLIDGVKV
jgi:hypothetical protein